MNDDSEFLSNDLSKKALLLFENSNFDLLGLTYEK